MFLALCGSRVGGQAAWIGSKRTVNPGALGLANDAAHGAFGVELGEIVAAEIGVLDVVGEHVPHRDQNRVFHGDKGFLLPTRRMRRRYRAPR
jgi:hypothetical protein